MRIDFYHINLLKDTLKLKEINTVDVDCNTTTNYNLMSQSDNTKKDSLNLSKDYLDINNMLDMDESNDDEGTFLSEEDLSKLRKSIKNNEYNINLKALSMSLIKYIERC